MFALRLTNFKPRLKSMIRSSDYAVFGDATDYKIAMFRQLPAGWRYGEGVHVTEAAARVAAHIKQRAGQFGYNQTDAFPGVDGSLVLSIYDGDISHDFTVHPDGSVDYILELNGEDL